MEALEARAMLAGDLVISEFMATNNTGLKDQDNAYSDWIEIHNRGDAAESLNGWFLTDTNNNLSKWRFPAVSVPADGYLVVFASDKNRAVAGAELHTNFKLGGDGEYLALIKPDALTVASEYSPQYPGQVDDISYGISESFTTVKLVQLGSAGKLLVPTADIGNAWTGVGFNDSTWTAVTTAIGFDTAAALGALPAYTNLVGANGTQSSFTGSMGQDFTVNNPISITSLGVFDSAADGLKRTITSQLWQRNGATGTKLAEMTFTSTDPGTLVNSNRFKDLAVPLVLAPGNYSIVSYGYGGTAATPASYEPNGNENTGGPMAASKVTNSGGGAISFTGTRFSSTPGDFPLSTTVSPFFFSAATFQFTPSIFQNQISTNVQTALSGVNASAYLRLPFNLTEILPGIDLSLNVKYDDGFIAYLNGTEVARRNAPGALAWNSAATAEHPNLQAVALESIDIAEFVGLLNVGGNVLSIQALNASASNGDFLFNAELVKRSTIISVEQYYAVATPGAANSTSFFNQIDDLEFSKDHGFYDADFDVTIASATPGVTIRYTTNGSAPTANTGTIYSGPVHISTTTTLRAGAFKAGFASPTIETKTYLFLDDVVQQPTNPPGFPANWNAIVADYQMDPDVVNNSAYVNSIKNDLKSIPTLSIVTPIASLFDPATGIYSNPVNEGTAWERAASAEWINPDGSEGFQIDAGLRIYGGYSRNPDATPKHSFRLAFRAEYGSSKLEYPVFPDSDQSSFDTVVLRAQFNYAYAGVGAASNATFLQDEFARKTQLEIGDLSGHGRFVQLYLNGVYWGLYNILERPDVDFAALHLGGKPEDYDLMKTFELQDGNNSAWNSAMALANAGLTSDAAYQTFKQYVDVKNLADYIIVNVYGGNWDWPQNNWVAMRRSRVNGVAVNTYGFQFFSSDAEGTLYDINADRSTADADGSPGRLYLRASQNAEFRLMFADRLQKFLFNGGALSPTGATATHNALAAEIDRAIVGESARWGDTNSATPFTRNANWAPQINWLNTQFFPQRTQVVLNQFKTLNLYPAIDPPTLSQRGGMIVPGSNLTLTTTAGLTIYMTTNGSDPRLQGGNVSPNATIYSGPIALQGKLDIKVRTRNAAGVWSALDEALFAPDTTKLRVTELMYNPLPPAPGGQYFTNDYQYVELQNTGATAVDLSGVHFENGIDYTFPSMMLAAGARVVVASNPDAFAERYPGVAVVGPFAGGVLSHVGEHIRLETAISSQILDFDFDGEWYDLPQAQGYSLVIVDPAANPATWSSKASWRPSQYFGGNPMAGDVGVNPDSIVINEVLANTSGASGGRIELYNTTAAPIDISGWYLSNTNDILNAYRLPAGSIVAAGGYRVIDGTSFSSPSPGGTPFTLGPLEDQAYLSSSDPLGNLAGYREKASFAASDREVSYGRYIKSTGGSDFVPLVASTFGAPNAGPIVGPIAINEVMYHPTLGGDDFIELLNTSNQPVPLFDPANPAASWAFTAGLTYSFPTGASGVTLPAGGYALVVGIAPLTFRNKYGIPGSVPIFGPFTGALDNAGEAIEISKPAAGAPGSFVPIDRVTYQPDAPWPTEPDGGGFSLSRYAAAAYGNDVANWRTSTANGTPGSVNISIDTTPPSVPASVKATYTAATTVTVNWAASTDFQTPVTLYRIFRDSLQIGTSTTTSFTDTNVLATGMHNYQIAAVNGDGYVSTLSAAARSNHLPVAVNNAYSVNENSSLSISTPVNTPVTLVQGGSGGVLWKYLDNGSNQGTAWRAPGFNDAAWAAGRGELGYGDGDETTVINGGPANNRFITSYFRHTFNVAAGDTAMLTDLSINSIRDDGISVYLNGTEIFRNNLPGTTLGDNSILFSTLASASHEDAVDIFSVPDGVLHDGANTLAVEIHQRGIDSSDISFDLTFTAARFGNGLLNNDTDVDDDPLTAEVVTPPAHGTLSLAPNGAFTYTPFLNYNGADSFTYLTNDGRNNSSPATVNLTIPGVNHAPIAVVDSYTTDEDAQLSVVLAQGVLANDTDPEVNLLTAAVVAEPSHGVLVLNLNGSFTYTPAANYSGADSFTYRANDGTLNSNTATVSLTVTPVNDAPVAVVNSYTTDEDVVLSVAPATGVLANDTDLENNSLTAAVVTGPSHGVLVLNPNGSFTYTPAANYSGADSFTYRANDGALNSNTATVSLTGTPVNDAPVAVAGGPYTVAQGANLVFDATGSSDAETAALSLTYEWDLNYDGVTFDIDVTGAQPSVSFPSAFAQRTIGLRVRDQALSTIVTTTLEVTTLTSIVGRHLVYNNSLLDGNDSGGGATDDAALATDKQPLLPGGTATLANYSNYSRGINGVMLDVANLGVAPTAAHFTFRVGNDNTPALWAAAPAPLSVSVRAGAGSGGSSRVTILWADGAIKNQWLQVTTLAGLGLAQNDVFYFGNAVGESGDSAGNAVVNSTDEIAARANPRTFLNPAPADSPYDFNRDGFVNATDQILARSNSTTLATALSLISVPLGAQSAAASAPSTLLDNHLAVGLTARASQTVSSSQTARPPATIQNEVSWQLLSTALANLDADQPELADTEGAQPGGNRLLSTAEDLLDDDLLDLLSSYSLSRSRIR